MNRVNVVSAETFVW